jgi:hypothetical protein
MTAIMMAVAVVVAVWGAERDSRRTPKGMGLYSNPTTEAM